MYLIRSSAAAGSTVLISMGSSWLLSFKPDASIVEKYLQIHVGNTYIVSWITNSVPLISIWNRSHKGTRIELRWKIVQRVIIPRPWGGCIKKGMYYKGNLLWGGMYNEGTVLWRKCIMRVMYYEGECIMNEMYYGGNLLRGKCIMRGNVLWGNVPAASTENDSVRLDELLSYL